MTVVKTLIEKMDYFFVLRPIVLIPIGFFFLIGYFHGRDGNLFFQLYPPLQVMLAFFLYMLVGGGIYIINQIYDKETDHVNRKLFIIADGHMSVKAAWVYTGILYSCALFGALWVSRRFFLVVVFSIVMGFLYSARPFHFKGRPVLDMLSNSLGNGVINFFAGYLLIKEMSLDALILTTPYQLAIASVYLATTVADMEGDKKAGDRTTGVVLGEKKTAILACALMFGALALSLYLMDWLAFFPALLSFPFYVKTIYHPIIPEFIKASRVCTALMALAVGVIFPWFAVLILMVVIFSRWYYRERFGLIYPKIFTKDRQ